MSKRFSSTTGTIDETTGRLETTPILGAPFWRVGVKVAGVYARSFTTAVGECYEFMAANTFHVMIGPDGKVAEKGIEKAVTRFAMGALTGFEIAMQRLDGFEGFKYGDQVVIECNGFQKSQIEGQSDMPLFKLDVVRP